MFRCEVRPGPEFLTRSYTFHPSRHFQALQHYYSDSSCEDPAYSLMIRGKLRLRQASWITRGGTEAEHHLSKVGIVVHSMAAKQRLASSLPQTCVTLTLSRVVLGKPYELYNTRAGRGCLAALGFSMLELGLLRVETQHHSRGGKVQELLLGDIHTDWAQRTQNRPTGYQQPLQNAMVRRYCVCIYQRELIREVWEINYKVRHRHYKQCTISRSTVRQLGFQCTAQEHFKGPPQSICI